jgi:hypothetical protein
MQKQLFVLLIALLFAAKEKEYVAECDENYADNVNKKCAETIFVKIEEDEHAKIHKKEKSSKYIGVTFNVKARKWYVKRQSKHEKKVIDNGCYENEETAARASDNLARKLMENSKQKLKLNFPDDNIEVYQEKSKTSKYIGVSYEKKSIEVEGPKME